ncbi:MAG: hypothetical protein FJW31_25590 [Acidobacteria bacterium]|nr:hypothetical protein [Acidobacteriota bacterium]
MIVPRHWAEGRVQRKERGRQVTVRRFGWSDVSEADAQAMADRRAAEALARILAGESKLSRHEPKIPYNGAEGVPIREEILAQHGDVVITRNSYGVYCLNTPNVLIADVDFADAANPNLEWLLAVAVAALTLVFWRKLAALALLILLPAVFRRLRPGREAVAWKRVRRFSNSHPDWRLRIYTTPVGLRVLVTHRRFQPAEPAVAELFDAWEVDPVYRTLCLRQNCFRARLTAKPWRAGMLEHLRPRPGVWPVTPASLPVRQAWVDRDERIAADFAACRFVEALGPDSIHFDVQGTVQLHDRLSRAATQLPLA